MTTQTRIPFTTKRAAVAALGRLAGPDADRPLPVHIHLIAEKHGVGPKAVYKWWNDPALRDPNQTTPPEPARKKDPYRVTLDDLTVYAQERSLRGAWRRLTSAGVTDVSYTTFTRAMHAVDPALLISAKEGTKMLGSTRLYASSHAPHSAHTYNVDHTDLDLYVAPSVKNTKTFVRPRVTVVVDNYSSYVWAFPWYTDVNGDMVAAALVDTCIAREVGGGVVVGGIPEQVVLDNAKEHFAPSMRHACTTLGITFNPTMAYASHQNGPAERAIGLLNRLMADRAPGAIHAGQTWNNKDRHLAPIRETTDPETVLSKRPFELLLAEVVAEINTTFQMDRHKGLTRLEAWDAGLPNSVNYLGEAEAFMGMLPGERATYTANKAGIRHRNTDYVAAGLEYGRKYKIRYLPSRADFIEVFDLAGNRITRAYQSDNLPPEALQRFLNERTEIEQQAKAVEQGSIAFRRHVAALKNAAAGPDEVDPEVEEAEAEGPTRMSEVLADPAKAKKKRDLPPVRRKAEKDSDKTVPGWALRALENTNNNEESEPTE